MELNRRHFCQSAAVAALVAGTAAKAFAAETDMIWAKAVSPDTPACRYPGLNPRSEVRDGIRIDYDVPVRMRDGVILYTDIYRPEGATNVPALVAYSPYGKQQGPKPTPGVAEGSFSDMTKFEGPDPAYWCKKGYAVIHPDARGSYMSGGDIQFWGKQEGRDNADVIEWVAVQDWSNGKVGMAGSSWLAISQWFAAAERPRALKAIAPWQGFDDYYRSSGFPGGIPETGFVEGAVSHLCGQGRIPNMPEMMRKYPLMNGFWEDKIAAVERINVPAYVVNTFNHFHSLGTLDAFRRMGSRDKWLRITNEFEWPDLYDPANVEDLRRFFDHYLLGKANGWEKTPRVRLSVMNPGGTPVVNRPETSFPLARQSFRKFHLDAAAQRLVPAAPRAAGSVRYSATEGQTSFAVTFDKRTEITGYMKLRLWIEARGGDDADLFVYVRKLGADGAFKPAMLLDHPHPGAQGWMRVSHRELDPVRSTASEPYQRHRREQMLRPGEIVPVDIGIWPTAMIWEPGEQLEVLIAGRFLRDPKWFERFRFETRNKGEHVIHAGGKYDSYLLVPIVG